MIMDSRCARETQWLALCLLVAVVVFSSVPCSSSSSTSDELVRLQPVVDAIWPTPPWQNVCLTWVEQPSIQPQSQQLDTSNTSGVDLWSNPPLLAFGVELLANSMLQTPVPAGVLRPALTQRRCLSRDDLDNASVPLCLPYQNPLQSPCMQPSSEYHLRLCSAVNQTDCLQPSTFVAPTALTRNLTAWGSHLLSQQDSHSRARSSSPTLWRHRRRRASATDSNELYLSWSAKTTDSDYVVAVARAQRSSSGHAASAAWGRPTLHLFNTTNAVFKGLEDSIQYRISLWTPTSPGIDHITVSSSSQEAMVAQTTVLSHTFDGSILWIQVETISPVSHDVTGHQLTVLDLQTMMRDSSFLPSVPENQVHQLHYGGLLPFSSYNVTIEALSRAGVLGVPVTFAVTTPAVTPPRPPVPVWFRTATVSREITFQVAHYKRPTATILGYQFVVIPYAKERELDLVDAEFETPPDQYLFNVTIRRHLSSTSLKLPFYRATSKSVRVRAISAQGLSAWSDRALPVDPEDNSVGMVAAICIVAAGILGSALIAAVLYKRTRQLKAQVDETAVPDFGALTIHRDNAEIQRLVGTGSFGFIFFGELKLGAQPDAGPVPAAIKMARKKMEPKERKMMIHEANIMAALATTPHPHVIRTLGLSFEQEPFFIALEWCRYGDLKNVLSNFRQVRKSSTLRNMARMRAFQLNFCLDIARGMEHLASLGIVHRDLAARNCLVKDGFVVAVGDFGLSCQLNDHEYFRDRSTVGMPIRWMSPEALIHGLYDESSDVWSLGVVIWEILTLGNIPYWTYELEDVPNAIVKGHRLSLPEDAGAIESVVRMCFLDRDQRPGFSLLARQLERMCPKRPSRDPRQSPELQRQSAAWHGDSDPRCSGMALLEASATDTPIDISELEPGIRAGCEQGRARHVGRGSGGAAGYMKLTKRQRSLLMEANHEADDSHSSDFDDVVPTGDTAEAGYRLQTARRPDLMGVMESEDTASQKLAAMSPEDGGLADDVGEQLRRNSSDASSPSVTVFIV